VRAPFVPILSPAGSRYRLKSSRSPVLVSFLLLAGLLLACGCSDTPGAGGMGTGAQTISPAPIVGTWLSPAREPGDVRDLYLFKDSGRADATVVPGNAGETLPYEVHLQGSWKETPGTSYLLTGEEITHYFTNDSHSARPVRDVLRYDGRDDRLYRESDPVHPLERVSREPVIPPGMNVSIPWD
jgi:hypothetical protein